METGQEEQAEPYVRREVALNEKLVAAMPGSDSARFFLAGARGLFAILLALTGRPADAEKEYRHCILLLETVVAGGASAESYRRDLAEWKYRLANLLSRTGRPTEAQHEYRDVLAILEKLTDPDSQGLLAQVLATVPDSRLRDPRRAVGLAQRALAQKPNSRNLLRALGYASYRAGNWAAASDALENLVGHRAGGQASDCFFLAMARWQQNDKAKARFWYDKALDWSAKGNPRDEELRRVRDETAALLGVTDRSTPTATKEKDPKQTSKP
jgi:tetratricopeptide (TPR) repeat protein